MRYGPVLGGQLSLAMLGTSGRALTVAERQGYAGAEAKLLLRPISFTFGAYSRFSGSAPGDARLFSAGVGVGF